MIRNRPPSALRLLRAPRFGPLFWTQAAAGFNDNLFKQAAVLFLAYRAGRDSAVDAASLTALAGAVFVLPFVLLSAFAGTLADTHDKARLARLYRLAEIGLMALAGAALLHGGIVPVFAALFALGCQAALFGPVKYSLLPAHLRPDELVLGNALVEGATFASILVGSIAGGVLVGQPNGPAIVAGGIVAVACAGYLSARRIPPAPPAGAPVGRMGTLAVLRDARANRPVWAAIGGISWFWVMGATLLAFVPPLARDVLGGDEAVASTLLGLFSAGIAVGSLLCARHLGGAISARPVPAAGLAMSGLLLVLAGVLAATEPAEAGRTWAGALFAPGATAIVGTLVALSVVCGFFAVPLYAIMQHAAPEAARARVVGANNIVNAVAMVAGALALALLSGRLGLPLPALAVVLAALNAAVAWRLQPLAARRFG